MADGMSEDSAELAQIRRRQYLFDQTIQIHALCISAETAVIPHLSLFFFAASRIPTSLDAAASERQSLGASSNSLMCFGDDTRVSRWFGVRITKGPP